ncbi:putative membrane protein [Synechococcus sp. A18-46.1]|nr:putative membrane protein [Synechococcus sp. A18-46.1]
MNYVHCTRSFLMEILVIAAVFIPFSALVMNAFAGDAEDDFDFL